MINATNKTRRTFKAIAKSGVSETHSTVRDRVYGFAVVVERKAVLETRRVEVPSFRLVPCKESATGVKQVPHSCVRIEEVYGNTGTGEVVASFHTSKALALKALPAGPEILNAYIVETVQVA